MRKYEIESKEIHLGDEKIPIIWKGRVAVAGGGTSGVTAATAAARKKIPALIIEKNSYFGGEISNAAACPIEGAFPGDISQGGLMDEILAKLRFSPEFLTKTAKLGTRGNVYYYEPEYAKRVCGEFLEKSGCSRLLNTVITDVLAKESRIEALIVCSGMKKGAVLADVFVDATGNALISESLGVPVVPKLEKNLYRFPYLLDQVDVQKWKNYSREDPGFLKALALAQKEHMQPDDIQFICHLQPDVFPGMLYADTIRIEEEGTKLPGSGTDIREKARKILFEQLAFYRAFVPGMENCRLQRCSGDVLEEGGNSIMGSQSFGVESAERKRQLSDGIARCRSLQGDALPFYQLPYGVMAVPECENLLVTGKGIAADYMMKERLGAAGRMVMGQAAGIAAAVMSLKKIKNTEVDGAAIKSLLDEVGCDIDGVLTAAFCPEEIIEETAEGI